LSAICKRIDPVSFYNPAINDCQCPDGYKENKAANRCDPVEKTTQQPETKPLPGNKDIRPASKKPGIKRKSEVVSEDRNAGGDSNVTVRNRLLLNNRETFDASSKLRGDFNVPVQIDGQTVFMTSEGADYYNELSQQMPHDSVEVKKDRNAASSWWDEPAPMPGTKNKSEKETGKSKKTPSFWE
jgi:hypothetical protein